MILLLKVLLRFAQLQVRVYFHKNHELQFLDPHLIDFRQYLKQLLVQIFYRTALHLYCREQLPLCCSADCWCNNGNCNYRSNYSSGYENLFFMLFPEFGYFMANFTNSSIRCFSLCAYKNVVIGLEFPDIVLEKFFLDLVICNPKECQFFEQFGFCLYVGKAIAVDWFNKITNFQSPWG